MSTVYQIENLHKLPVGRYCRFPRAQKQEASNWWRNGTRTNYKMIKARKAEEGTVDP